MLKSHLEDPIFGEYIVSNHFKFTPQQSCRPFSKQGLPKITDRSFEKPRVSLRNSKLALSPEQANVKEGSQSFLKKSVDKTQIFVCRCPGNKTCLVCSGSKQTDSNSQLVKFLEYVLDFKRGKCQSYVRAKSPARMYQSTKLNQNKTSQSNKDPRKSQKPVYSQNIRVSVGSECRIISESTMAELCEKEKFTHQGYNCDQCAAEPIIGSRYHCRKCEDYDVCEKCYHENGHQHDMKEFATTRIHSQIKCVVNCVSRSQKLRNSNLNATCVRQSSKSFCGSLR